MTINIEEIRETLSLKREEMSNNRELTNELVIDDLMIYLGYNKKRDINVKKATLGNLSWEITEPGKHRIAIKVYAVDEKISQDEINESIEVCKNRKFSILIVTNGEIIKIYRYIKTEGEYIDVYSINISEDLSDTDNEVIKAISKDNFDMKVIDKLLETKMVTEEEIEEIFNNNLDRFKKLLISLVLEKYPDCTNSSEQSAKFVSGILQNNSNTKSMVSLEEIASENKCAEQVHELTAKLVDYEDIIKELKETIAQRDSTIEQMSGANEKKVKEMLELIEDNKESKREYVGVLNTQLVKVGELHEFVGRFLQLLYEAKSFEANQYIYNGDIFEINSQNPKYNDMILNNKPYEILIDNSQEDEAISKLRVIFSHFDDLVFDCKKIGTLTIKQDTGIDEEELTNNCIEFGDKIEETDIFDNIEETDIFETDTKVEETDIFGNIEEDIFDTDTKEETDIFETKEDKNNEEETSGDESDLFEFDSIQDEEDKEEVLAPFSNLEGFDEIEETNKNMENKQLLVAQLLNVDRLLWSEENIQFLNIKYIGTNSVTFNVSEDNSDSYDSMFCKAIDAILAVQAYNNDKDIIFRLKQKDLSLISNFIKYCSSEYASCSKINGTKYVVCGFESLQQAISVLYDICNELDIDTTELFIYIEVNTESDYIINNYGYQEESVQLRESSLYNKAEEMHEMVAILKGDLFNNIVVTKNSLMVHKDILLGTLAVKTKYMAKVINDYESIIEAISAMINEANNNEININYNVIGNVIGEKYKIISDNINDVSERYSEVNIGGKVVYISQMEDWQIPHSLIKMHTSLFNNSSIAIKVRIDADAVNFYGSQFETSESSMSLAVNSFSSYVASCVK